MAAGLHALAPVHLPATVLLLTYLSRGSARSVRSSLLPAARPDRQRCDRPSRQPRQLPSAIVRWQTPVGLGGPERSSPCCVGFLLFAVFGWAALVWIGRRYQAKQMSDESVTVDALWMLFAIATRSISCSAIRSGRWRAGLRSSSTESARERDSPWLAAHRRSLGGPRAARAAIVLDRRATANGCSTSSAAHWRRVGGIQMIAGIDLARQNGRAARVPRFRVGQALAPVHRRVRRPWSSACASGTLRARSRSPVSRERLFLLRRYVEDGAVSARARERRGGDGSARVLASERRVHLRAPRTRPPGAADRWYFVDRRTDEALLAETLGDRRAGVLRFGQMKGPLMRQLPRPWLPRRRRPRPTRRGGRDAV